MEEIGLEKRDLLKRAVSAVRNEQKDTGKEFQDALTQLKTLYNFQGGSLEKGYTKFKAEYDDCETQSNDLTRRIHEMDKVASDLFREWEREINDITTPSLANDSRNKLYATRTHFQQLSEALHASESRVPPVLRQFKDQVLYLKHNLNASAIGSLRTSAEDIQADTQDLIARLGQSITEADAFIALLQ
jgi:chromosome segregation ATPase